MNLSDREQRVLDRMLHFEAVPGNRGMSSWHICDDAIIACSYIQFHNPSRDYPRRRGRLSRLTHNLLVGLRRKGLVNKRVHKRTTTRNYAMVWYQLTDEGAKHALNSTEDP